jgi:hypothetical protein
VSFSESLDYGQVGESLIARWMRRRGNFVLPVYEKEIDTGKGPRLFAPNGQRIAPDMLVFGGPLPKWVEAKHKTAFSWHRLTARWVTGIDLRHYQDYLLVDDETPFPVWLLFLQRGGHAKDSPVDSPSGLFGNSLSHLRENENHRHGNWGPSGMVYWAIKDLRKMATLEDVQGVEDGTIRDWQAEYQAHS